MKTNLVGEPALPDSRLIKLHYVKKEKNNSISRKIGKQTSGTEWDLKTDSHTYGHLNYDKDITAI